MPGPLIPILGYSLLGLAGRKAYKNQLEQEAERQRAINEIDIGLGSASAQNRFDDEQLAAMAAQLESAQGMLRSNSSRLRQLGAQRIQALDSAVRGQIQQNENEMRADIIRQQDREILAAGLGKGENERRFTRELTMNEQLNTELKAYGVAELSFNKVMNLLDNDDQLASLAGLTAFVQAIDNSVVREGELLKYQGANGFVTALVNIVNKSEGRDFDPVTKQSIRNASAALMNAEKSRSIAITNSYQDRALSFGLDPKRVLSGVSPNLYTPIPIDNELQKRLEAEADAAEAQLTAAPDSFETVEQSGTSRAGAVTIAVAEELVRNTGILLRGSTLKRAPDGTLFEFTKDGELIKIDEAEILKASRAAALKVEQENRRRMTETGADRLLRQTPTQPIERR